jgi:hypothetical protein
MKNAGNRVLVVLAAALMLVVVTSSPALAQGIGGAQTGRTEARHEGVGIGIKGGWLFSKLTSESVEFDQRTGQQIGLFFGGNRPGLIGVMAELNYGKKGTHTQVLDQDYDARFVSVPVVLRVNGGSKTLSGVSGYGIIGPQLDWLISETLNDLDLEDTEGFEVSLVAGAGIEITRFIVELRYIHGLKSISRDFNLGTTDDLKSKAFGILYGFRFN